MSSAIDPTNNIVRLVRTALGAQPGAGATRRNSPPRADSEGGLRRTPDLGALIASRVAAIAPDDPQRKHRVFRVFLEATLLAELGEHLQADPAFGTMVDAVQDQMTADPRIAVAVEQAVQALLLPPSPRA